MASGERIFLDLCMKMPKVFYRTNENRPTTHIHDHASLFTFNFF